MRRAVRCLIWALALAAVLLELRLAWSWLWLWRYVQRWGAAGNPYAAEDMELTGLAALFLLPLALGALGWMAGRFWRWNQIRAKARGEK